MSHLPIPDAVTRWVHTARREDLETLAAAQLNTTAQMRCAYDWDGAADWLETIARTATEANQRLLSPNGLPAPTLDGDEGMFAWRIWLGPSVDTWQQDYDPTTPSQWQPTYACEAPEPWTEPMVRQMADHLTEQQTGVFLSILGRGVDDWHDACLTSDDILEALDALDAALTGTPHPETLRAQKEAEQRARDLRWNRERVALAAAVQAVQAVCPAAHDVRYRLAQGSWKVVGLYNGDGEPLTGHGSPWDVLLSMLPQLSGDLPLDDITAENIPDEDAFRWLSVDRVTATTTVHPLS